MFRKHLNDHGISYRDHQKLSFFFARESLKTSFMAFVHGLLPNIFETNASELHKTILPRYKKLFKKLKHK